MKVKDLKAELSKYDDNMDVKVYGTYGDGLKFAGGAIHHIAVEGKDDEVLNLALINYDYKNK